MYSLPFSAAVTKALSLRAIDRFKSMAEFRAALGWVPQPKLPPTPTERTSQAIALSSEAVGALLAPSSTESGVSESTPAPMEEMRGKSSQYQDAGRQSNGVKFVAAIGIVLIVIAVLIFFLR